MVADLVAIDMVSGMVGTPVISPVVQGSVVPIDGTRSNGWIPEASIEGSTGVGGTNPGMADRICVERSV